MAETAHIVPVPEAEALAASVALIERASGRWRVLVAVGLPCR